ncbi:MAG: GH92 family glycosyl hydrolase [Bacteroidetes bacterium]|nr:GH92 family glycosyl hydrolase [Bacteroidota bacterium]
MLKPLSLKKAILLFVLFPLFLFSQKDFSVYVNPFIGTGGHGHTFPGATVPFGMVQLSPDTRLTGWDGCSGYHYSDKKIYGFSHTHLSGTGCSDYGDVMLMPTVGKVRLSNKNNSSTFKKETEKASAGYYCVFLDKPKVKVELTSTTRTGLHKYTFPKTSSANVILDLTHRDRAKKGEINITGNNEISGYRISSAWASNQHVYFVIQFSKPFKKFGTAKADAISKGSKHVRGSLLKAFVQFETEEGEMIYARVGISAVSVEGARKNLEAEQPSFDFEKIKTDAVKLWNKELGKIEVESDSENNKRTFYTALYHSMIAPNVYQDVDGKYRGRDLQVHETKDYTNYTVFSLWDTYRALHPLLTIIDRKRTSNFVNTFITQYKEGGLLPIWELAANETYCMIGYHAVPVITDAYLKGIPSINAELALQAMRKSAETDEKGLRTIKLPSSLLAEISLYRYKKGMSYYFKNGYIKNSFMSGSVAKTLEFAYDDWCIAQMAAAMDSNSVYEKYIKRAQNYKNVYDPSTHFMRARTKRGFVGGFDPFKASLTVYCEANAWQYSPYVPQDISGLMQLAGGKERYSQFLDSLFQTTSQLKGLHTQDISGMIGQYAHGNEPSHHVAYMYNYTGQAWKTQAMTRRIMSEFYLNKPDGLPGNEDCGQMSAWYVFSALGFYPVCPGSDHYAIGSPLFDKAIIHLENGKSFTIQTSGNGKNNFYINAAKLNGANYSKSFLEYADIANGGTLELNMSSEPNKNWGSGEGDVPVTKIEN